AFPRIEERFLRSVARRTTTVRKKKPGHSGRNDSSSKSMKDVGKFAGRGDHASRCGAGGVTGIPDEGAVDEDFFDAGRKLEGFFESGMVDDGVGIEENKVGEVADFECTAILPVQTFGGERCHFANRFW